MLSSLFRWCIVHIKWWNLMETYVTCWPCIFSFNPEHFCVCIRKCIKLIKKVYQKVYILEETPPPNPRFERDLISPPIFFIQRVEFLILSKLMFPFYTREFSDFEDSTNLLIYLTYLVVTVRRELLIDSRWWKEMIVFQHFRTVVVLEDCHDTPSIPIISNTTPVIDMTSSVLQHLKVRRVRDK